MARAALGLLQPRVRSRGGRARVAPRPRRRAAARADRRRGGDRGQQLRRRDAAGRGRVGRSGPRGDRVARPAGGDRRGLPRPRGDRAGGCAARGGRHHQPHAPRRLRARDRRATGAILRAHPSNFRQLGFVQEVEIEELCELGVPVIDDVGSGLLADELEVLRDEPPVRRSVARGRGARVLLRRQAARWAAGGADRRPRGGRRRCAGASAGAGAAARQARARGPGGHAAALPRPGAGAAGDPGAGDAHRLRRGPARPGGVARGGDRGRGRRRRRRGSAAERCRCSSCPARPWRCPGRPTLSPPVCARPTHR